MPLPLYGLHDFCSPAAYVPCSGQTVFSHFPVIGCTQCFVCINNSAVNVCIPVAFLPSFYIRSIGSAPKRGRLG